MFVYYRTPDNTITEQPFDGNREQAEVFAKEFAGAFGFVTISIGEEKWTNEDWDIAYGSLERDGYFTRERYVELFDAYPMTLDRMDEDALNGDSYWH